jgi:hypothetical protein
MSRKILLIHDKRRSWQARSNNTRKNPIGFEWFKKLINSDHNHIIKILVHDYCHGGDWSSRFASSKFDYYYEDIMHNIEEYHENEKISRSGVKMFFSDEILNDFLPDTQDKMKVKLNENGITLVNSDEFFIEAVNDGFEIFF